MTDLISRKAAKEAVCSMCRWEGTSNCDESEHPVDELPPIDPVKHGKCEEVWNGSRFVYECTICGQPRSGVSEWNYCPDCGAS